MKVVELNEGRKIEYELNGTKLDFADGTLTVNLAKYQRDSDITKTVIGDKDGNLLLIDKPDTLPKKERRWPLLCCHRRDSGDRV